MAGKAGLKAGLIGTVVLAGITLITQRISLPQGLFYALCGGATLIYTGIGALAGFFLPPPRTTGEGAKAGIVAGLISGTINAIIGAWIMSTQLAQGTSFANIPPETQRLFVDSIANPTAVVVPAIVCGVAMELALTTIGGAILAAVKSN